MVSVVSEVDACGVYELKQESLKPKITSLRTRMQTGVLWNFVATVANQGSTFAANILVARLLGKEIFGQYAMVQNTLLMLSMLACLATGITATKYVAEYKTLDPERTGRILGLCAMVAMIMSGFVALLILIGAPWLSAHALKEPHLAAPLIVGAMFLFFTSVNGYQVGAMAGLEAYPALAKAGIYSGSITLLLCAVGARYFGLLGAVTGLTASAMLRCLIHNRILVRQAAQRGIVIKISGIGQERALILRFALPAAINGCITMPVLWLVNVILVQSANGYTQMALYAAATNIRVLVLFLPNVMNNVGLSILNSEKSVGGIHRYSKVLRSNVTMIFLAALTAAATIALFGKHILALYGNNFVDGWPVLMLLLVSTIPESLAIGAYQHMQSQERMWLSLWMVVIPRESIILGLAYLFIRKLHFGAVGLAIAYTSGATWACITILSWIILSNRNNRIPVNQKGNI